MAAVGPRASAEALRPARRRQLRAVPILRGDGGAPRRVGENGRCRDESGGHGLARRRRPKTRRRRLGGSRAVRRGARRRAGQVGRRALAALSTVETPRRRGGEARAAGASDGADAPRAAVEAPALAARWRTARGWSCGRRVRAVSGGEARRVDRRRERRRGARWRAEQKPPRAAVQRARARARGACARRARAEAAAERRGARVERGEQAVAKGGGQACGGHGAQRCLAQRWTELRAAARRAPRRVRGKGSRRQAAMRARMRGADSRHGRR